MPGPTLELNVSVPGLAQVTALSEALDALATKAAGLGIPASAGGLDKHLEHMATQSKSAMQEMQATLATGFAGLAGQIEAFSKTQGRNRNAGVDEAAKTVADQLRIEQAGYEKRLAAAEEFSEAQLRAAKAAGIRLSMGHKLALSSGVSGETGTGAGFEAAGGSAAAEVLASQKASAEKKKLLIEDWELANYYQSKFVMLAEKSAAERLAVERGLSKALTAMESQVLFEATTRNDHLTRMAEKSAAERLAVERGLSKALTAMESQVLFEATTRNDHLTRMAEKSAAERLAVERGLSKALTAMESQVLFEATTRNDHLTRMAKKAADDKVAMAKALTKTLSGMEAQLIFEAETRNDHLTRMAKKSADERLAIEKALFVATNNLGRAAVATERFSQASPESKVSGASMARAKLAAGFSAEDVAMAHGFAAATYNADGALDKLSKSASKSGDPLKDLANNLGSTHSAARGLASGFNAMWLTWGNVGPLLAGAALSHSIMQAVKEGSKLEQTLTSMSVLGRTSTEDMAGLRKELDKLAVSGPQGIQEIASAMKTLTLAGLDAKNTAQALSSVMNFSMAGELPVEKAAEVLVAVGTAYGYTAKSYSYVANMITSAAVSSTASVDSMSESFKQATSLSSTFGVSLKDTSLGLALLAQTGVQGSAAGTALRNFYSDIVGRTPKVVAALKQLDVSAYYKEGPMKGQIKDFQTLGTELSRAALKITDVEKRTRLLQDVLSERGGKVGAGLSQALLDITVSDTGEVTNGIDRMAKEIEKSMGIVEIGAARMKLTAQSQMKQTANVFQQAFQEAFLALEPTIIVVTKQLQGIFGSEEFKQGIVSITVSVATLIRSLVEYKDVLLGVGAAMAVWKTAKFGMALGGAATELATGLLGAKVAYNQGATAAQVFTAATGNGVKTLLATQAAATTTSVAVTAIGAASNAAVAPIGRAAMAMQFLNKASGWIGVIASLLTTAASAWGIYALYQKKATDDTAEATKTTYADLLKSLDEQVVRQREILAKLREGKTERQAETAAIEAGNLAIADRALLEGDWGKRRAAAMETLTRARAGTSASPVSQIPGSRAAPEPTQAQRLAEAAALRVLANIDAERVGHLQALKDRQAELGRLAIATGVEADKQRKKESDAEQARIVAEQKGLRGAATTPKPSDQKADELANLAKKIQYQKDVNAELTAGASIEAAQATAQFMQIEGARQNIALVNKFNDAWAEAYAEQEKTKKLEAEIRAARDYKAETDQLNAENELLAKGLNLKQARADIEGKRLGFTPEAVTARTGAVGTQENLLAEQEKWKKLVEDLKSEDPFSGWGRSLSAVFKSSGDAVEQLIAGSRALNKSQIDGEEALTAIKAKRSEMVLSEDPQDMRAIAKLEQAQIKKTTQQQLASYATIASGAKKLLKEHTTGYKVLEAAEKGFRVYQMYMANQKMVEEVAGIAKTVGAFLFGETAKVGATATGQASRTALETAGEAARNVAKVPGVFMSFMSSLGPYGLAAAGVAIAAVLGSAFSGTKGSAADSAAMQETQGTGTVFGDPKAKSESLTKALEHLQDVAAPQLKYTAQMAASLRNIESALVGVSGQIIRSGGKLTGANFSGSETFSRAVGFSDKVLQGTASGMLDGMFLDGVVSNMANRLSKAIFGSTKTTLQDAGIQFGAGSLQNILAGGIGASGYESTQTVKKKLFGLSKQTSYATSSFGLDPNLTNQFTNVIKDVYASITSANTALGISAEATKTKLAGFSVELGRISLKGLNSAQIQEQLTAVFGAFSDRLATAATESVSEFQKAGEGYFETLVRVASETELAQSMMDKLGLSMISYKDITYKQSNVVDELVRQSILAVEGLTGIGEVVNGLTGDAAEIAETYTALLSVRYALQAFGSASMSVSASMIAGAGDLDTLAQGAADYTENFLSESERLTKSTSDMARQFARLGVTLPDSNEAFKTLLLGIDGSTEAGQKLYGSVLALSGSFAELSSSAESFDTSKVEMQLAILKAQGKSEEALAIERERTLKATDPMLKALQQEVWATEDAAKATQTLTESLNKLNDAGKQISDYLDSLTGPTAVGGQLAVSRGTYLSTLSGAKESDLTALGKITGAASTYLKDAENFSRTSAEYLAVMAQVKSELANLEAVKGYKASIDGSHASGLDFVPFDGYTAQLHKGERVQTASQARHDDAVLAELQALRVESKSQQTVQATQALLMRKILDKWDQDGMPAVRT